MDATGKRVLVAEDNRVMSDVIRFNLQRTGVIVSVAHSGTHALELLQSRDFDALLSDYQMPGMNGEQLCRSVRTCGRNEQIPIVMVSAKGLELDKARLESELGLTRFLHKPFSARQMIDAVHDALATHTA